MLLLNTKQRKPRSQTIGRFNKVVWFDKRSSLDVTTVNHHRVIMERVTRKWWLSTIFLVYIHYILGEWTVEKSNFLVLTKRWVDVGPKLFVLHLKKLNASLLVASSRALLQQIYVYTLRCKICAATIVQRTWRCTVKATVQTHLKNIWSNTCQSAPTSLGLVVLKCHCFLLISYSFSKHLYICISSLIQSFALFLLFCFLVSFPIFFFATFTFFL